MSGYDFDLFVIGGGSGGVRCARIAAGHGARVAVAEDTHWGGTCVNVGCVPKKIMVQASEYARLAEDSHGFGWDGPAPKHDWAALIAHKDKEIARLNAIYQKLLGDAGVTMFNAHASFIDPHTLDVGGRRITSERIVIATGGTPMIQPPIAGMEHGIVSDDAFHLPSLPRRVLLVGSGYIAVEFAGIFSGLGAETHMVYRQSLPLRGFDHELREALAGCMEASGIHLHCNQTIHSIERAGEQLQVTLSNGKQVTTDLVFFAVGRAPRTDRLGLERAGIAVDGRGAVVVNAENATSQPNVFAIGDVSNKLNLTPVAIAEGHHLADRLFGRSEPRSWFFEAVPTAVFSTPPLATIGLTEEQAAERGPADIYVARFTPMRHVMSGRGHKSLMKLVVDQPTQRILGAHILGDDAPEMMQGIGIAITAGATKSDFDRTVGIHPTSAEELVTMRTRARAVGLAAAAE